MTAGELLDDLVAHGVLAERAGDLSVTAEFETTVDAEVDRISDEDDALVDRIESVTDHDWEAAQVRAAGATDSEFLALYLAVAATLPDPAHEAACRAAIVLQQLRTGLPESHGAPSSFVPVRGDQLETVLALSPRAIVYVWLDDCDPCETMQANLDAVVAHEPDSDLGLFAVYGPNWTTDLYETYDVAGGPTTLFVVDGTVDARLQGEYSEAGLATELETFQSVAAE